MNVVPHAQPITTTPQSGLSFTQGFLLGQLSIVLLLTIFIKFFIFGDPPPSPSPSSFHTQTPHRSNHQRVPSLRSASTAPRTASHPSPSPATILAKTYYNVHAHQPESLDWFNVLIAQTLAQVRSDALADNAILSSLTTLLNGPLKPEYLETIRVTEIGLGEEFPIFSNCRVHPAEDGDGEGGGRLQAWMDVDLSDFLTLGVETIMVLNYPRPRTAVLPVALTVSVVRFSGTLSVSFVPVAAPSSVEHGGGESQVGHTPTTLAFSFLPNYTLSLSTRSLLGSRSRLQDVPKIAQLVESRLRMWFEERCVQPRMQQVAVPNLWPRMKNVVEGDGGLDGGRVGGVGGGIGMPRRERDLREEARREVEEERREREGQAYVLRRRVGGGEGREFPMPGAMPGMLVS